MVLTLLQGLAARRTHVDLTAIAPSVMEHALELGLGPVVEHLAGTADHRLGPPYVERIRAADLTARALTSAAYDSLAHALAAARHVQCPVILLKGAATALRYYPSPHLRPMGDIDVLVPVDRQAAFEDALRTFKFRQFPIDPWVNYDDHLHSAPFWDPERDVWIEVHTSVFPRDYRLAQDPRFSQAAIAAQLTPIAVRDQTAYAMNHELQLIYTSARWSEMFDPRHGVYPILDAALLIREHGDTLDWERILALVEGSWAALPLHLMLWCLDESDLSPIPPYVLHALGTRYCHLNRHSRTVLRRMIVTCVIEGRFVKRNEPRLQLVWTSLVRPKSLNGYLRSIKHHLARPTVARRVGIAGPGT
jgi:putative nucleotidyltransferase-like protein